MRLPKPDVLVAGQMYAIQGSMVDDTYVQKLRGIKEEMCEATQLTKVRYPGFKLKESTADEFDVAARKSEAYPSVSFLGVGQAVGEQGVLPTDNKTTMRTVDAIIKFKDAPPKLMSVTLFGEHARTVVEKGDVVFFGNAGLKTYLGKTVCSMNQYSVVVVNPDWNVAKELKEWAEEDEDVKAMTQFYV